MGGTQSTPCRLVDSRPDGTTTVYLVIPDRIVLGGLSLNQNRRDEQLSYLEKEVPWGKLVNGFDFLQAFQVFEAALKEWDYPELKPKEYWSWHIDRFQFYVQADNASVELEPSNSHIQFFVELSTGKGWRRNPNGNNIAFSTGKRLSMDALLPKETTVSIPQTNPQVSPDQTEVVQVGYKRYLKPRVSVPAGVGFLILILILIWILSSS